MMRTFHAHILIDRMTRLGLIQLLDFSNPENKEQIIADLKEIRESCSWLELRGCSEKTSRAIEEVKTNFHRPDAIIALAKDLLAEIQSSLPQRLFLYIREDRSSFVDQPSLFGTDVAKQFPSANFDIREAGNCLAAECPTAAVFHLMRAVEWGLRALGTKVSIRRLRCHNKKTGKFRYTPLEWAQWEEIINQIKSRIAYRIVKAKRGPKKQQYAEFYNPAVENIERFKDTYRNHIMHTRREYERVEAFLIFDQVERFMMRLASQISEC